MYVDTPTQICACVWWFCWNFLLKKTALKRTKKDQMRSQWLHVEEENSMKPMNVKTLCSETNLPVKMLPFPYSVKMFPERFFWRYKESNKQYKSNCNLHYWNKLYKKWQHCCCPFIPCWPCSGPDTRIWHVCSPQLQSRSCPQRKTHLSPYWTPCWQPRLHLSVREHNSPCSNPNFLWA